MTNTVDDPVLGIHHVTAVSGNIAENLRFYTGTLGMRLVRKSVNRDDVKAYHLFYADAVGSPGTDLTFFDWPHAGSNGYGPGTITQTSLRVNGSGALDWWERRLQEAPLPCERNADGSLRFPDPEGQRLRLVDDTGLPGASSVPWNATVPAPYARCAASAAWTSSPLAPVQLGWCWSGCSASARQQAPPTSSATRLLQATAGRKSVSFRPAVSDWARWALAAFITLRSVFGTTRTCSTFSAGSRRRACQRRATWRAF